MLAPLFAEIGNLRRSTASKPMHLDALIGFINQLAHGSWVMDTKRAAQSTHQVLTVALHGRWRELLVLVHCHESEVVNSSLRIPVVWRKSERSSMKLEALQKVTRPSYLLCRSTLGHFPSKCNYHTHFAPDLGNLVRDVGATPIHGTFLIFFSSFIAKKVRVAGHSNSFKEGFCRCQMAASLPCKPHRCLWCGRTASRRCSPGY